MDYKIYWIADVVYRPATGSMPRFAALVEVNSAGTIAKADPILRWAIGRKFADFVRDLKERSPGVRVRKLAAPSRSGGVAGPPRGVVR